ncbi:MAG: SpoIID/LytB domain-containing protein [Anaerolineae bacterium]|nr:SpoIID/LytB domain-containing protein [Gloeobacterales cyanobacterium ES-bin-313]
MRTGIWVGLLSALVAMPAQAVNLRLAIVKDGSALIVGSSIVATVTNENNQVLGKLQPLQPLPVKLTGTQVESAGVKVQHLHVIPDTPTGLVFIGDRWFRGTIDVSVSNGKLLALNLVDMESYLYGVVGAEMPSKWSLEALKAQAVAARTYALYNWTLHHDQPFDLGDTTRWQVYKGAQEEADSIRKAVDATSGLVMTYNGQLINAMYHDTSGGHTENVKALNGEDIPYLSGVEDFDQDSPYYRWRLTLPIANVMRSLALNIGNLLQLRPQQQTETGRPLTLVAVGKKGTQTLKASDIRSKLHLKSEFFEIAPVLTSTKPNASLAALVFNGRGFGHGLGMSQYGARALAAGGWNYQQILKYYYQGIEIQRKDF